MRPFIVSGPSMLPAFQNGDGLWVETISPRLGLLQRGDAIIFRDPRNPKHPIVIKRIIGLPNETVRVEDDRIVIVERDGRESVLEEPWLVSPQRNSEPREMKLGPEDYFLLGDNRQESEDSRHWGTIQPYEMIGRPILRLSPFTRFALFP